MKKNLLVLVVATGFAVSAMAAEGALQVAQAPVGNSAATAAASDFVAEISGVQGAAAVTDGSATLQARDGMRVTNGVSVKVPDGGQATVTFDNGCAVQLSGGQSLTVNSNLPCDTLMAMAAGNTGAAGAGGAAGAPSPAAVAVIAGGLALGAIVAGASGGGSSNPPPVSAQ